MASWVTGATGQAVPPRRKKYRVDARRQLLARSCLCPSLHLPTPPTSPWDSLPSCACFSGYKTAFSKMCSAAKSKKQRVVPEKRVRSTAWAESRQNRQGRWQQEKGTQGGSTQRWLVRNSHTCLSSSSHRSFSSIGLLEHFWILGFV